MFKTNSLVAVTSLSRPKTEFYQSTMPYSIYLPQLQPSEPTWRMECANCKTSKRMGPNTEICRGLPVLVTYLLRQLFRIGLVFGNIFYHKITKRIPVIRRKIEGLQEK